MIDLDALEKELTKAGLKVDRTPTWDERPRVECMGIVIVGDPIDPTQLIRLRNLAFACDTIRRHIEGAK